MKDKNMIERIPVPIWKKYSLSVEEAAEYYGIGEKRIYSLIHEHAGADFILEVGSHIRIKRELFERFLDETTTLYKTVICAFPEGASVWYTNP